ncbi:MAG: EAL domain-containing protein [Trichocoleus desertorum ATA4-8-CV12]|jgi:diguanylate cyclase (GGDEF)-like protein|nr:EAL domain-containing protein [Trichocoleus desertorum ATA4-8-CV12]
MWKAFKQTGISNGLKSSWRQQVGQTSTLIRSQLPSGLPAIAIAGFLVTGGLSGVKQLGWMQPAELLAFDQMVRLQPDRGPDPRLLVVAITEADIRDRRQWPISDQVIAQALANLQQHQPSAIGLDIFRDIPTVPGEQALATQFQEPNVFGITYLGNHPSERILPPATLPEDQIGFNDLVTDPDGVVRRSLMFASSEGMPFTSLSLQLAVAHLKHSLKQSCGLTQPPTQPPPSVASPTTTCADPVERLTEAGEYQLGKAVFSQLQSDSGAYQTIDDRGYQFLLRYRSFKHPARQVSLQQVLQQQLDPNWVKHKVVLIGTTANSIKDLVYTPYSQTAIGERQMPGVVVHAQVVSQILDAASGERSLFWFWPHWGETLWIGSWAIVGGILARRLRHPMTFGLVSAIAVGSGFGICTLIVAQAGWVPFMTPALALVITGGAIVAYQALYASRYDTLTGLPNRSLFLKQLQRDLQRSQTQHEMFGAKSGASLAVLFLDLDRFKVVNDSMGHHMGDRLLVNAVQRLKSCLRSRDLLARVGGDEFVVLLRSLRDVNEATAIADQIQQVMTPPFRLNGQPVFASISIGIALSQAEYNYQPEELLRDAHTALYRAKDLGKACYEVFSSEMHLQVVQRFQIESDLRRGLEQQEFQLHYQPIVSLSTGKIVGFEALVRWRHPQEGLVAPADFIPIAEETGLIVPLGQWILQEACQQLRRWQDQFPFDPPLMVSINLSGHQFAQPDLATRIEDILHINGLDGHSVKLEITETVAMKDVESTIRLLLQLRALNLRLSIDDFGTGYSSLSYLHRFPVDTLKVDRSFVSRMGDTSEDATIVQTITMLGHTLGMDVIAEGVETAAQHAKLQALNCEYAQGYLFSKPLDSEGATALLAVEWQRRGTRHLTH